MNISKYSKHIMDINLFILVGNMFLTSNIIESSLTDWIIINFISENFQPFFANKLNSFIPFTFIKGRVK